MGLAIWTPFISTRIIDYFVADDHEKVLRDVMPAVRTTGFWEGELIQEFRDRRAGTGLYNIFSRSEFIRHHHWPMEPCPAIDRRKLADQRLHLSHPSLNRVTIQY